MAIMHVDVNSAYVSWSAAEHLRLGGTLDYRTVPSVVGGDPKMRHGIVLARSIPAKKYKIQTAELVWQAVQKCPHLLILKPNFELYTRCSKAMIELLREYSDRVLIYSIDEAFVDLRGMELLFGDPVKIATEIRERIRDELGFTVSAGVGETMIMAKMASELKKPDATSTLWPDEIESKMWPLPLRNLFMCGPAAQMKLARLGIRTIGQLAALSPDILRQHFDHHGEVLWRYAHGREAPTSTGKSQILSMDMLPRGVGNSTTIAWNITDRREASLILLSLAESVGARMRAINVVGKVIEVHLRNASFDARSKQRKLPAALSNTTKLHQEAVKLLNELWPVSSEPLRNLGIRVSGIQDADTMQLPLEATRALKEEQIDRTVDQIRKRYGLKAVTRAAFLHSGIRPMTGGIPEEGFSDFSGRFMTQEDQPK